MRWRDIETAWPETDRPTYRQFDVWTRRGHLAATAKIGHGGRYRDWDDTQITRARLAARLTAAGWREAAVWKVVDRVDPAGPCQLKIAPNITLTITPL